MKGILLVDKPAGMTSHDVVDHVRRASGMRKIGHTGTLDPSATGLLILCLGPGTRLSEHLTGLDKVYEGDIRFGQATDTYDASGTVTDEASTDGLTAERVAEAMRSFEGDLHQNPPPYCATKVGGVKFYELARRGEAVPEKTKAVHVWTFEPSVAEMIFDDMCRESGVVVVKQQRLDLKNGVEKRSGRIISIRMESGQSYSGRMFVDATYEGDLMAKAGVSYTVGREANSQYGETLNGVEVAHATKHQFIKDVDPYVKPGDPSSGLLPLVQKEPPGTDGDGDRRVQAGTINLDHKQPGGTLVAYRPQPR